MNELAGWGVVLDERRLPSWVRPDGVEQRSVGSRDGILVCFVGQLDPDEGAHVAAERSGGDDVGANRRRSVVMLGGALDVLDDLGRFARLAREVETCVDANGHSSIVSGRPAA